MKFCHNCGTQLSIQNPKFCPECGVSLAPATGLEHKSLQVVDEDQTRSSESLPEAPQESQPVKLNVYDIGVQLERATAAIFEKMGYSVKTRQRPPTKSGGTAEIDILLERGTRRKAVECKNYDTSRSVGVSELRIFKDKLADTGIAAGVFVTTTSFSEDAERLADSTGIERWDGDQLKEKFFAYAIGRILNPSLIHDPILPLALDFLAASALRLKNSEAVHLFSAVLLYHPYIQVKYRLHAKRNDPTGKSHTITDDGTYFVDAIDEDIINRERLVDMTSLESIGKGVVEGLSGLFKKKEERLASKEDKMVSEDLRNVIHVTRPVLSTTDYQVSVAEPSVSEEDAGRIVKSYVVEKNSQSINYEAKVYGEWETRSFRAVPRASEVAIRGTRLVFVPKWNFEYEAGQWSYSRRILASSGRIIEDELAKCNKCSVLKRSSTVVCEQCGKSLCDKHSYQEDRWLCEDHISASLREKMKSSGLRSKLFGRG